MLTDVFTLVLLVAVVGGALFAAGWFLARLQGQALKARYSKQLSVIQANLASLTRAVETQPLLQSQRNSFKVKLDSLTRAVEALQSSQREVNKLLAVRIEGTEVTSANLPKSTPDRSLMDLTSVVTESTNVHGVLPRNKIDGIAQQKDLGEEDRCALEAQLSQCNSSTAPPQLEEKHELASKGLLQKRRTQEIGHATRYVPMKHLVVTDRGDRWVADRLPKNEDLIPEKEPQRVDELISKPVGYRLIAGENLLRNDDL